MNGRRYWAWRAVNQDGMVLAILVQTRRNQNAAETFLRRVRDGCGTPPRVVSTDKLASYPPAIRRVLPGGEHRRHKGLNNRAETSHRPTRRRERALQRFTSPEQAQRFVSCVEPIRGHFCPRRHVWPAARYRAVLADRMRCGVRLQGSRRAPEPAVPTAVSSPVHVVRCAPTLTACRCRTSRTNPS